MTGSQDADTWVEIIAVCCDRCLFRYDPDIPQPATVNYLRGNTWEHIDCGGRILFTAQPANPKAWGERLLVGGVMGFPLYIVDQMQVKQ